MQQSRTARPLVDVLAILVLIQATLPIAGGLWLALTTHPDRVGSLAHRVERRPDTRPTKDPTSLERPASHPPEPTPHETLLNGLRTRWLSRLVVIFRTISHPERTREYFPNNQFILNNNKIKYNNYYETSLVRFGEPSLWERARVGLPGVSYRFLWLPSEGNLVSVRAENHFGVARLKVVVMSGSGQVVFTGKADLSPQQWESLREFVREADFWKLPTRIPYSGFDGEDLLFEGVMNDRYHVVVRWCPESGSFRRLCRCLMEMAGFPDRKGWYETRHVEVPLGRFALIRKGIVSVAIRFVRHTEKGDGGALHEWFLQEDGSHDFSRPNLISGSGEVFENYKSKPNKQDVGKQVVEIPCGPVTVRWSPGGTNQDQIYLRQRQVGILFLASSPFESRSDIDFNNKELLWFEVDTDTP